MRRNKKVFLAGIMVFFFMLTLCFHQAALAQKKEAPLEFNPGKWLNNYVKQEREHKEGRIIKTEDYYVLIPVELLLSLLSLYIARVVLSGDKKPSFRKYMWFLVIFNVGWLVSLFVFKVVWGLLYYLVMKLRPEYTPSIAHNYTIIMIFAVMGVYMWSLARTFGLNFYGALGTFFISHVIYCLMVFLIIFTFFSVIKGENRNMSLIAEHMGLKALVRSYVVSVDKITSGDDIFSLIRLKPFHM